MPTAMLLALSLLACGGGKTGGEAYFGSWSCDYQPWDWYGGAVQAVMAADDNGDFDFDPPSELVTKRVGSYDFATGDFGWTTSYLDGYYGVSGQAEGYGTIFDNGDLDLLYKSTFEDVLGELTASRVRVERTGCTSTTRSWDVDPDASVDVTPSEDPLEWSTEIVADDRVEARATLSNSDGDWTYDRVFASDLSTQTGFSTEAGDISGQTTFYGDGTGDATQVVLGSDIDSNYEVAYHLDGSRSLLSTGYYAGTSDVYSICDYDLSYEGTGGGTCSFDNAGSTISCDLTITTSACQLDCGADGVIDC